MTSSYYLNEQSLIKAVFRRTSGEIVIYSQFEVGRRCEQHVHLLHLYHEVWAVHEFV